MYGWLWRKLPGRWPLKTLQSLVLVLVISAVLVTVVFPWIEPKLPFSGNTVQDGNTQPVSPAPGATDTGGAEPDGTDQPAQPRPTDLPVLPGE